MMRYNPSTGDYVLMTHDDKKAAEVGFDLSTSVRGPQGEKIWFTKEPYAALVYYKEANDGTKAHLDTLYDDYVLSQQKESEAEFPAPTGLSYLPYQRAGIQYALKRRNCLIGDEMGLGKTVEAIGVNNAAKETKVLVVCPASIRLNWQREIVKWSILPNVTTYPVLKSSDGVNPYANYTIISYDLCRNEAIHDALMDIDWDCIIFDEAHFLKTEDAKRTRAMFGGGRGPFKDKFLAQRTKRILALTGTPLPNRPRECYVIAKGLCHDSIDWMNFEEFCFRFNPSGVTGNGWNREEQGRLPELRARLRCNFMVRRLKKDVLKDLPAKRYEMSHIEPNGAIQRVLAKERMVDFDPGRMFDGNFELDGTPISTLRKEMGEAKIPRVVERMKYLLDILEIPKVVMFCHHKTVMDLLAGELSRYGVVSHRGGMTPRNKQQSIDDFVTDPKVRIFNCQLDTSFGIDGLQRASNRVVFAEPAWTPGTNEQALDRCHRIGQHDNVIAEFLITEGSFDELVLNAVLKKSKTIHISLDKDCGQ